MSSVQLCRYIKGPDFPTGGQMLNSPEELKEIWPIPDAPQPFGE